MGFERWQPQHWLSRRKERRLRRRMALAKALAATRFVTVATIVDAYHPSPGVSANDNVMCVRSTRRSPPLTIVS